MVKIMITKKAKRISAVVISAIILIAFVSWIAWANTALELNKFTITSDKLPKSFDGYRIAHISDLHNAEMGKDNKNLLTIIDNSEPDIIVITGDLIDSRNTNIEIALNFVEKAMQIAPCYYVTGNHEERVSEYTELKEGLNKLGTVILENTKITIEKSNEAITVIGVNDPNFEADNIKIDAKTVIDGKLCELKKDENNYTVLLSHRPELFDVYEKNEIDLALCGHVHGGQFRLPFLGGLASPNQGLFPKYDAGLYTSDETNMIVSRGIGNSLFPFRFNNRPEVVLVELKSAQ